MTNELSCFSPGWGSWVFTCQLLSWLFKRSLRWWESRLNLIVREKQSENFVLFSNSFCSDISVCFSFGKSWWNDLERIMPVVLGILWSYSMQCEGPAACPKSYEIEWRLILDVLQCHSLNLRFYELSPFSSDFLPLPPTILLCNDLCRARDFTFSLFLHVVNIWLHIDVDQCDSKQQFQSIFTL